MFILSALIYFCILESSSEIENDDVVSGGFKVPEVEFPEFTTESNSEYLNQDTMEEIM